MNLQEIIKYSTEVKEVLYKEWSLFIKSSLKNLCETLLDNNVDNWYYFWGKNYERDLINE